MPKSVKDLLADSLSSISLNILVFGPQVTTQSTDPRTQKLQAKRQEIKAHLAAEGHTAKFAEELVDPALPATAFIQELVIMEEYDLIVVLVETPGSIVEMTMIARTPTLARKSALFLDEQFNTGLPADACKSAADVGAFFQYYKHPDDLVNCHLLTFVSDRAEKMRLVCPPSAPLRQIG
jgi:hypothetical protein